MENRAYALAAGLFTILLGIGVVATALWFSGEAVDHGQRAARRELGELLDEAMARCGTLG